MARLNARRVKFLVLLSVYPFICYALYQDSKAVLPWYAIASACILGLGFGLLVIIKIIEPTNKYIDNKITKLLRIK